jgi:D-alanine-D-alanine ligase-like ATP-grasp enzyme
VKVTILCDRMRADPLAWIHRTEARSIARELRERGYKPNIVVFDPMRVRSLAGERLLLRLSDPVMRIAAQTLSRASIAYHGPRAAAFERCYDKLTASTIVLEHGMDVPLTILADAAETLKLPLVIKPRRGSDSVGLRLVARRPIPARLRTPEHIAQTRVCGVELTVALSGHRAGFPLQILLPRGTPYSFTRKYVVRPRREPLADVQLAERVRTYATRIATALGVSWAARVDFLYDASVDRLWFLECDAAPLVSRGSAFAASFAAAGRQRDTQLRMLLGAVEQ